MLGVVLEYYGSTSEVPWLFLLTSWIAAVIVVSFAYASWNRRGLRLYLRVGGSRPGPGSPVESLPDQVMRGAPLPAPIFEGDAMELDLGLDTDGAARGPAKVSGTAGARELSAATGVVPRTGWRHRVELEGLRRGPVGARSWVVESSDLVGFFRSRRSSPDAELALVLPRFASLTRRPEVHELEASLAAPRAGSGTELVGVREYRPGDSRRRIHWRSSARHGELVVREYEPPGVHTLGIFCDPNPAGPEAADQVARLAASEAWDCIREGGRVMLWAPGLEPSRPNEARSLWALLEWLARYPFTSPPRGEGGAQRREGVAEFDHPPAVSEAVAVTGSANPDLVDALETVRRRGGAIRAWVVGDADLDVDAPVQHVGTVWPL
ncbi:MAG: DUF58 domain-containing protein [Candidatus Dormiibacterota bacterium]